MENDTAEFCKAVREFVVYWDEQPNKTRRDRLYGLAFSILRLLDGLGPNFKGSIHTIAAEQRKKLIHHAFRDADEKKNQESEDEKKHPPSS